VFIELFNIELRVLDFTNLNNKCMKNSMTWHEIQNFIQPHLKAHFSTKKIIFVILRKILYQKENGLFYRHWLCVSAVKN